MTEKPGHENARLMWSCPARSTPFRRYGYFNTIIAIGYFRTKTSILRCGIALLKIRRTRICVAQIQSGPSIHSSLTQAFLLVSR
jgi:hypothetical protein